MKEYSQTEHDAGKMRQTGVNAEQSENGAVRLKQRVSAAFKVPLSEHCRIWAIFGEEARALPKIRRKKMTSRGRSFFLVHFQGLEPWAH